MADVVTETVIKIALSNADQVFCRVVGFTTGIPIIIAMMLGLFSDLVSVGHDPGIGFSLGITQDQTAQVLISCFLVLPAIIQTRIDPLKVS